MVSLDLVTMVLQTSGHPSVKVTSVARVYVATAACNDLFGEVTECVSTL